MRLYIFFTLQILYSITLQGTRPIISMYSYSLGVSELVIGLLISSFALMPMIYAVRIGKWLDLFGAKTVVTFGGTGMVLALFIPIVYPSIVTLFLSQMLMGISHLSTLVSLQKTVGNFPGNRDKLIAVFSLMGSTGELLGPLITGFSYEYMGFRFSFSLFAVVSILAIVGGLCVSRETWMTPKKTIHVKEVVNKNSAWGLLKQKNLRKALIASGLVLFSKDVFVAYFPLYGSEIGLSASNIGILLSLSAAASIFVRVIQFKLVHFFGRANVLTTSLIMSGICFALIPIVPYTSIMVVFVFLLGGCLGLGQPISLVYALTMSPTERQGEVLGLRLTFNRGFQFLAPFAFGSVGTLLGLAPVFWFSGFSLLLGSYITRMREGGTKINDQELKQNM